MWCSTCKEWGSSPNHWKLLQNQSRCSIVYLYLTRHCPISKNYFVMLLVMNFFQNPDKICSVKIFVLCESSRGAHVGHLCQIKELSIWQQLCSLPLKNRKIDWPKVCSLSYTHTNTLFITNTWSLCPPSSPYVAPEGSPLYSITGSQDGILC